MPSASLFLLCYLIGSGSNAILPVCKCCYLPLLNCDKGLKNIQIIVENIKVFGQVDGIFCGDTITNSDTLSLH